MAVCLLCYPKIKMLVGFDIVWILQEFFLFLLRIISFSSLVSWVIQNILIIFLTCLLTEHPDPNSNWVICVTAKSDGKVPGALNPITCWPQLCPTAGKWHSLTWEIPSPQTHFYFFSLHCQPQWSRFSPAGIEGTALSQQNLQFRVRTYVLFPGKQHNQSGPSGKGRMWDLVDMLWGEQTQGTALQKAEQHVRRSCQTDTYKLKCWQGR